MKTIININTYEVSRLGDDRAEKEVKKTNVFYCPKQVYKAYWKEGVVGAQGSFTAHLDRRAKKGYKNEKVG